jgi:hypothetical protein
MSDYLDKAKDLAKDLGDKARTAVSDHSDKIDEGIDKAAEFVDDKTKHKYSEKIEGVQSKAHAVVEKISEGAPGDGEGKAPEPGSPGGQASGEAPGAGSTPG